MTSGEGFVRGLAEAVPEAFAGVDLDDRYEGWPTTIALADTVKWIEHHALRVDRVQELTSMRAEGAAPLRRFFAYMEGVIAAPAPDTDRGWIMVELFEGIPWVEDVL